MSDISPLSQLLLPWYYESHRDLPWRKTKDPYAVWLSEIMLQQTRVEAVKHYYDRFLQALPTIESLANCDDEQLHKLWEGLGYYSRVRNLKKAANVILERHSGVFPHTYEEILALPGIGEYTAGAISSIVFDLPTPAVDGNVLRVLSRLLEDTTPIDTPAAKSAARSYLLTQYPKAAGDFTQALMELGATVCGPNQPPDCENCPCKHICKAHHNGTAEKLPVKSPKKEKKTEEKTVFILSCNGKYALHKRADAGLLAGLWEFPNVTGKQELPDALAQLKQWQLTPKEILRQVERSHIFTHIRWEMRGIYLEVAEENTEFVWRSAEDIRESAALPTAFRQFFDSEL